MDAFEARYAKGEGQVYFRDKIPVPPWFLGVSVVGAVAMAAVLGATGVGIPVAIGAGVGLGAVAFFGNLALMGLRVVVSDAGVDVFTGVRHHRFHTSIIEGVEPGEYRFRDFPLGKGLCKRGLDGSRAFVSPFGARRGAQLRLKGGRRVLITTNDPQRLIASVERVITGVPELPQSARTGIASWAQDALPEHIPYPRVEEPAREPAVVGERDSRSTS